MNGEEGVAGFRLRESEAVSALLNVDAEVPGNFADGAPHPHTAVEIKSGDQRREQDGGGGKPHSKPGSGDRHQFDCTTRQYRVRCYSGYAASNSHAAFELIGTRDCHRAR